MEVKVTLVRNAGRLLTWNQKPWVLRGELMAFRVEKDDAMVAAIGVPEAKLYDPKINPSPGTSSRSSGSSETTTHGSCRNGSARS
jgi:hypothetical protein